MNCEYCFNSFDATIKVPIKLSCSHTFCKECIEILEDTLKYCPIDNLKVDYSLGEINQEILDELAFKCPQHDMHCIGVCYDHCCPLCEECKTLHSACQIFKGTQTEISKRILNLIDQSRNIMTSYYQELQRPSIFCFNELIESVDSHLKTLDSKGDKFEKNLLSQEEKEKYLRDIEPILKIKDDGELFSPGENNQILKIPNSKSGNPDFSNLMKMLEKFNKRDKKVKIELVSLDSIRKIALFRQIIVNTDEYGKYFCMFKQTIVDFMRVNGFGIGTPTIEGGIIYISCFELRVNDNSYSQEIGIVEYIPDRLTSIIFLHNPIILPKDTNMFIHIEIEGTNNNLFKIAESFKISVQDMDEKNYSGSFPILFALVD